MFSTDVDTIRRHWHPHVPARNDMLLPRASARRARTDEARRGAMLAWWEDCLTQQNARHGLFDDADVKRTAQRIVDFANVELAPMRGIAGVDAFTLHMRVAIRCAQVGVQELLRGLFARLKRQTANGRDATFTPAVPRDYPPRRPTAPGRIVSAIHDATVPGAVPYSQRWADTDAPPVTYRVTMPDGSERRHVRLRDLLDARRLDELDAAPYGPLDDVLFYKDGNPRATIADAHRPSPCPEKVDEAQNMGAVRSLLARLGRCPAVFPWALVDYWQHRAPWARDMEFARHRTYFIAYALQVAYHADAANQKLACECGYTPAQFGAPFPLACTPAIKQAWRPDEPRVKFDTTQCVTDVSAARRPLFPAPERVGTASYARVCQRDRCLPQIDARGRTRDLAHWLTEYVYALNRLCGFVPLATHPGKDADEDAVGHDDVCDWHARRMFRAAALDDDRLFAPRAEAPCQPPLPHVMAHRATCIAYDLVQQGARIEVAVYASVWEVLARILDSIRGRLRMAAFRRTWTLSYDMAVWPPDREVGNLAGLAETYVPWPDRITRVIVTGPLPFWTARSAPLYGDVDARAGGPALLGLEQLCHLLLAPADGGGAQRKHAMLQKLALVPTLRMTWKYALWAYYWECDHLQRTADEDARNGHMYSDHDSDDEVDSSASPIRDARRRARAVQTLVALGARRQ